MRYKLQHIPGGLAGTDATIREIVRLVDEDLRNPRLRLIASRIVESAGVRSKDRVGEIRALWSWVCHSIRFQNDPVDIETVQAPLVTYRLRFGDCDDHVALLAGFALSLGIPVRYRVFGESPDQYRHIIAELYDGLRWWSADTTEPRRPLGWRPPRWPSERLYSLRGDVMTKGLGQAVPVSRGQFKQMIRKSVWNTLRQNWEAGLINDADIAGYIRVVDEGNFPTTNPLVLEPTRETMRAFRNYVQAHNIQSSKPPGSFSGLEGLDGFLKSVWNGIKSVAKGVVGTVGKIIGVTGGTTEVRVEPQISIPPGIVQAPVTPAAAEAGVAAALKNPIFLGLAAVLIVLLVKK